MNATVDPRRWIYQPFAPISLAALDAKAAMLERLDNKYVVHEAALRQALPQLVEHFDVLEIGGRRAFTYDTCYFDDAERHCYFDPHQERRRRCKVRVRRYTDAQLCFVEVKLKDRRGITVKKRLDYAVDKYGMLDAAALAHVDASYRGLYGEPFAYALGPVIDMRYRRITLVARDGGERMTIDCDLRFDSQGRARRIDDSALIIETKSANGNGIADRILRAQHQHPVRGCSKYCCGMASLQVVDRHNTFLPALRKLDILPQRH